MALYDIAWHCMALYGIIWHCMALYGGAWCSFKMHVAWAASVLYCIAMYCMVRYGIVLYGAIGMLYGTLYVTLYGTVYGTMDVDWNADWAELEDARRLMSQRGWGRFVLHGVVRRCVSVVLACGARFNCVSCVLAEHNLEDVAANHHGLVARAHQQEGARGRVGAGALVLDGRSRLEPKL